MIPKRKYANQVMMQTHPKKYALCADSHFPAWNLASVVEDAADYCNKPICFYWHLTALLPNC